MNTKFAVGHGPWPARGLWSEIGPWGTEGSSGCCAQLRAIMRCGEMGVKWRKKVTLYGRAGAKKKEEAAWTDGALSLIAEKQMILDMAHMPTGKPS